MLLLSSDTTSPLIGVRTENLKSKFEDNLRGILPVEVSQ